MKHIEPGFQRDMGWFGLEEKDHPVATPLQEGCSRCVGRYDHTSHQVIVITLLNLQVEQPWNMPIVKWTCKVQLQLWVSRVLNLFIFLVILS